MDDERLIGHRIANALQSALLLGGMIALLAVIADIVAGIAAYYSAGIFNVPGEVAGLPVLEFVGLALIVIGAVGLLGITALAARTKGK